VEYNEGSTVLHDNNNRRIWIVYDKLKDGSSIMRGEWENELRKGGSVYELSVIR